MTRRTSAPSSIDELLANPEWVDKWTMYFGDLYQNTPNQAQHRPAPLPAGPQRLLQMDSRFARRRQAVQPDGDRADLRRRRQHLRPTAPANWILERLRHRRPGAGHHGSDPRRFVSTRSSASPRQLPAVPQRPRPPRSAQPLGRARPAYQAWQLASYMSHTSCARVPSTRPTTTSTTGRCQTTSARHRLRAEHHHRQSSRARGAHRLKSGQPCFYVPPQYIFNGDTPKPGENYRVALARSVTSDFQFARATVNYMWAQFFGRGIVDPPDTFDPARLDPDNPPPAPWTLQPSNPALLNALAQHFIDSGYNLKAADARDRQLATPTSSPAAKRNLEPRRGSRTSPASSSAACGPRRCTMPSSSRAARCPLHRHRLHRAWASPSPSTPCSCPTSPAPAATPDRSSTASSAAIATTSPRKSDGSILQALSLMNNNFVVQRAPRYRHERQPADRAELCQEQHRAHQHALPRRFSRAFPAPHEMPKAQLRSPPAAPPRASGRPGPGLVSLQQGRFRFQLLAEATS